MARTPVTAIAKAKAEGFISANLALIKRLGPDAYQDEPLDAPYIALFERADKRLIFIAGDHGQGVGSAVAKTIRHALKRFKPQGAVVEGLSAGDDAGAADRLRQAQRFARRVRLKKPAHQLEASAGVL